MVCFLVFSCFWPSLPGIRPVYDGVLASLMYCVYLSKKKIFIETLILGNGGTLRFFNGILGKSLLAGICSYLFSSLDINILAKMLA